MQTLSQNFLNSTAAVTRPECLWQALFSGRYRIAAWYDRAGRRYLDVRPYAGAADAGFSLRQRRMLAARARGTALKVIAFDHGLSTGCVSRLLTLALERLGLKGASELPAVAALSAGNTSGSPAYDPLPAPGGLTLDAGETEGADGCVLLSFPLEPRLPDNLTPAERDVVVGILAGLPTRRIAERRGVSPRTVSNQIAQIFGKLRVSSRLSLALRVQASSAAVGSSGALTLQGKAPVASRLFV
jgi:DNA-binding NarL/FixJ family response regulator